MDEPQTTAARAVLFIRVNRSRPSIRHDQAAARFVDMQRIAGHKLADQLNTTIVREYVEYGGGGDIGNRVIILDMLGDLLVKHDKATYLLTQDWDRLARKTADAKIIEQSIQEAGVQLVTVSDQLDSGPSWSLLNEVFPLPTRTA